MSSIDDIISRHALKGRFNVIGNLGTPFPFSISSSDVNTGKNFEPLSFWRTQGCGCAPSGIGDSTPGFSIIFFNIAGSVSFGIVAGTYTNAFPSASVSCAASSFDWFFFISSNNFSILLLSVAISTST